MTVIGIDVAEQRKGLDVVALDGDRRIVEHRARATLDDVTSMVDALRPDVIGIDSPPAWSTGGRSRAAERELRAIGITAFLTPTDPGDHPFYRWMRVGFSIFGAVADRSPRFRSGSIAGTAVEVFPEATSVALAGRRRSTDEPKLVFRRGVLEANGVAVGGLPTIDAVDAALAALTGVIALEGSFVALGDPAEGVIVLPITALPTSPFTAGLGAPAPSPAPPARPPGPRRQAQVAVARTAPRR